ncbi:FAD-dependent oxidoreductase [Alkalicoccus saliphilus]|uniref:FAD-dependent oxidoreductase n=1 Tax=Alkalicoccus saliphilus TaxID=200989 RepID=A0A2T4UA36_9BACI|nr:FAD-dependent oxidoreductase [Alkalicoccus saliphilus]PTL40256.1 FAD-dependent oxidoreductase [Alkalicoccus saliphilus]
MPEKHNKSLPSYSSSYWREADTEKRFRPLEEDIEVDTAVVGGGIAGILTTYYLCLEGKKTVLIEGSSLLDGTTGFTTAKVTPQHDVMYDQLINNRGEEAAGLYYKAQVEAMAEIKELIHDLNIDCEHKAQNAVLHAGTEEGKKQLEKEKKAYDKLKIGSEFTSDSELPFQTKASLTMKNAFHFHPVKFLKPVINEIERLGGLIFENSTAVNISGGEPVQVKLRNDCTVTCEHAVMATHFPFDDIRGFYFSRLHPERSYTIAVKTNKEVPEGMFLGIDNPAFSLRHTEINGEKIALIGGEGHKTGKSSNTLAHYQNLADFTDKHFGIDKILYRWSSQDLKAPDNVPLIGPAITGRGNILTASGFKKWGMSNGMAAARLITDYIAGRSNSYAELFDPRRSHLQGEDIKNLAKEIMDDGKQFVASNVRGKEAEIDNLSIDEGAIVNINGKKAGAYRDSNGELHLVDPTCTHMKCGVEWNNAERTWDCPCHGSRFSIDGEVVEGPASTPLDKVNNDK